MNTVESQVQTLFYKQGICINCTDRPWYNNPFGVKNKTFYGIEVHKKDVSFVLKELEKLGIEYNILDGKYRNVNGCWTHKAFKFIELPNPEEAYNAIIEGGIQ